MADENMSAENALFEAIDRLVLRLIARPGHHPKARDEEDVRAALARAREEGRREEREACARLIDESNYYESNELLSRRIRGRGGAMPADGKE